MTVGQSNRIRIDVTDPEPSAVTAGSRREEGERDPMQGVERAKEKGL